MEELQSAASILMVRPANFGFNAETAASNAFQTNVTDIKESALQEKALAEFDQFVSVLRSNGVEVIVHREKYHPERRDSIFPNNWISFHSNGAIYIYPMEAPSRRLERDSDVIDLVRANFKINEQQDLSHYEEQHHYLEGTGSIIFDYENKKAYACLSSRTDKNILNELCAKLSYEAVVFDSVDRNGKPIYHTNVMMAIGSGYTVICLESIPERDRARVVSKLEDDGHDIISISFDQLESFAGNMLEVRNDNDQKFIVMSQSAFDSLTNEQTSAIENYAKILAMPIPTIETLGGGSTRCMMAAIHLPKK
jgi:hypothetical protein